MFSIVFIIFENINTHDTFIKNKLIFLFNSKFLKSFIYKNN